LLFCDQFANVSMLLNSENILLPFTFNFKFHQAFYLLKYYKQQVLFQLIELHWFLLVFVRVVAIARLTAKLILKNQQTNLVSYLSEVLIFQQQMLKIHFINFVFFNLLDYFYYFLIHHYCFQIFLNYFVNLLDSIKLTLNFYYFFTLIHDQKKIHHLIQKMKNFLLFKFSFLLD
jgi:hypothetical protein